MINISKKLKKRFASFQAHPLAKKSPLKAMVKYIAFNLIHSIDNRPRKYKWINGLNFYAQKGDAGIVPNIYVGLFDFEDSMFLMETLTANDVFVDVGANVGHFSLLAANSGALVYAIEPVPLTFKKLVQNVKLNQFSNRVQCYNYGISDAENTLFFSCDNDVMNRVVTDAYHEKVAIQVFSLDEVLQDINPRIIKIDVEGYEYFVLKGAEKTLRNNSLEYIIIELNQFSSQFGFSNETIHNIIKRYGFVPMHYDPKTKRLEQLETYNQKSFNTLYKRIHNV